jgi:hypothetical protein
MNKSRRASMSDNVKMVRPLSKISLILEAGTEPGKTDLSNGPIALEFILGAGSQGLCPIEFQLTNKKEGDTLILPVSGDGLADLFQHLFMPSLVVLESLGTFYLRVNIVTVCEANPRELIKAMAEAGSCGDHCCGH